MREWRKDRNVYRKAGVKWVLCTIIKWRQLPTRDQMFGTGGGVSSSQQETSIGLWLWITRGRKLGLLVFAHIANSHTSARGRLWQFQDLPTQGLFYKFCMGLMHWSLTWPCSYQQDTYTQHFTCSWHIHLGLPHHPKDVGLRRCLYCYSKVS